MTKLTAVILTLNEARHIVPCIESLRWADAILVLDSFSTDATVALAEEAGARVIQHPFENYSQQRNVALDAVLSSQESKSEWLFFVDADERATPELAAEIEEIIAADREEVGWWAPRHNIILGHRMRGAGWRPDYQLRLLRPDRARYDPRRAVHEEAQLDGPTGHLEHSLIHYNYDTLGQFIAKQRRYTAYDVGILIEKGVHPKATTPYTQLLRHVWWRFVTLEGWRDGLYGLLLSALMGYYEMIKYRRVRAYDAQG